MVIVMLFMLVYYAYEDVLTSTFPSIEPNTISNSKYITIQHNLLNTFITVNLQRIQLFFLWQFPPFST